MNSTARYQSNGLHLVLLCKWVVIAAFLGVAGLSYVYLKNQLHDSGKQRKALEQTLHELIVQNNVYESQIFDLTSRTSLQRRLDEGTIKLVPVSAQAVIRVHPREIVRWPATESAQGDQFRTVSHER